MITVTLVDTATGQSESIPLDATVTTVQQLTEWAGALFGINNHSTLHLYKDGQALSASTTSHVQQTLDKVGVCTGDLIAVSIQSTNNEMMTGSGSLLPSSSSSVNTPNLTTTSLSGNNEAGNSLDFSSLLNSTTTITDTPTNNDYVYYPGMNLEEAQHYNRHPETFCRLLLDKVHLWKELNYYSPRLAAKLNNGITLEAATKIWREELVKGGISTAFRATIEFQQETKMKERLDNNPNDKVAKEYFKKKERLKLIDEQYQHVIAQYPESMGHILMLYIQAKMNGHSVQAFCDSGAQMTIMSKKLAFSCGLGDSIDERMAGTAVGVGTGKILGRIHMVDLQIEEYWFPCTITVMDDPPQGASETPFLLGLDMMKRHLCILDLERGCLKFRLAPEQYLEAPFLHEKDLTAAQGGTKDFDAEKAKAEFNEISMKDDQGDH